MGVFNTKTKWIILLICLVAFIGMGWCIVAQHQKIKKVNEELLVAVNNNKAYELENSSLNGKILEFELSTAHLNNSNDSLIQKLNSVRKELKIKDKQIRSLEYIASENKKRDTIRLKDTIFIKNAILDTLIKDDWSALKIHGAYPNILDVDYSFKNETSIITHTERTTVDPPKKCWLARIFQKKHTIVEVNVIQENPYCENKNQKFIKNLQKN